ncbi:MAG: hypothetical protein NVS2B7_04990 [Herpetosiphon sp.]
MLLGLLAACGGGGPTQAATSTARPVITGLPIDRTPPATSVTDVLSNAPVPATSAVTATTQSTTVSETNATESAGTAVTQSTTAKPPKP